MDKILDNKIKIAMSWLKYNECFLDKGEQDFIPNFEKLKYIDRFTDNLNDYISENSDILTCTIVKEYIEGLYQKRDIIFSNLSVRLEEEGIVHQRLRDASEGLKSYIHNLFYGKISPEINIEIIDSTINTKYIKDRTTYLAISLKSKSFDESKYLIAEIPGSGEIVYTRFEGIEYILMEDIILAHVSSLVIPYEVEEAVIISLVRNKRLEPVKLDISGNISDKFQLYLSDKIGITENRIFKTFSGNSFKYIYELERLFTEEMSRKLKYQECRPIFWHKGVSDTLNLISQKDILTVLPFESPELILKLLEESVQDQRVLEIRTTIINPDIDDRVVKAFELALKNGKSLKILAEIKKGALAERIIPILLKLESSGAKIYYSCAEKFLNFEILQILYKDYDNKYRAVTHFSTSSVSFDTGKAVNFSFASSKTVVAVNLANYFDDIAAEKVFASYDEEIIAGENFEKRIISLIDCEADKKSDGRIFLKIDNLTNSNICKHLSDAARSGARIKIINSGSNIMMPTSEGEADNIEIVTAAGPFDEACKVYIFGAGINEKMFLSTADFDALALEKNLELAIRLKDKKLINRIKRMLSLYVKDSKYCYRLDANGDYLPLKTSAASLSVYEELSREALSSADFSAHLLQR